MRGLQLGADVASRRRGQAVDCREPSCTRRSGGRDESASRVGKETERMHGCAGGWSSHPHAHGAVLVARGEARAGRVPRTRHARVRRLAESVHPLILIATAACVRPPTSFRRMEARGLGVA